MRFPRLAALLCLSTLLAGCGDDVPKANLTYLFPRGSMDAVKQASSKGIGVPVFAVNSVFGTDLDTAERFAEALHAVHQGPAYRFTPVGRPLDTAEGTRILIVIDPPDGRSAISFCQGQLPDPAPDANLLVFRIAVCQGNRRLAEAVAQMPRPSSADASDYQTLRKTAARLIVAGPDRTPN